MNAEVDEIRNMEIEWDRSQTTSVKRGYPIDLFEKRGILDEFKTRYWPYAKTQSGETMQRRYLRHKQEYDDWLADGDAMETDADDQGEQAFAAERDLQEFLVKNLNCIERGLGLHQKGTEFPVDGGSIDILARDRNGKFVVVELKVSRGRNKAVGQLLYYMGWVDKHLSGGTLCRGLIIAKKISDTISGSE